MYVTPLSHVYMYVRLKDSSRQLRALWANAAAKLGQAPVAMSRWLLLGALGLAPAGTSQQPLPAGWQQSELSTGRTFFFQTAQPTEIFWEPPAPVAPPAPLNLSTAEGARNGRGGGCVDMRPADCAHFAAAGECQRPFMRQECRRSCKLCSSLQGATEGGSSDDDWGRCGACATCRCQFARPAQTQRFVPLLLFCSHVVLLKREDMLLRFRHRNMPVRTTLAHAAVASHTSDHRLTYCESKLMV